MLNFVNLTKVFKKIENCKQSGSFSYAQSEYVMNFMRGFYEKM